MHPEATSENFLANDSSAWKACHKRLWAAPETETPAGMWIRGTEDEGDARALRECPRNNGHCIHVHFVWCKSSQSAQEPKSGDQKICNMPWDPDPLLCGHAGVLEFITIYGAAVVTPNCSSMSVWQLKPCTQKRAPEKKRYMVDELLILLLLGGSPGFSNTKSRRSQLKKSLG